MIACRLPPADTVRDAAPGDATDAVEDGVPGHGRAGDSAGVSHPIEGEGVSAEQADAVDHHQPGQGGEHEHRPQGVKLRRPEHLARGDLGYLGTVAARLDVLLPAFRGIALRRIDHDDAAEQY